MNLSTVCSALGRRRQLEIDGEDIADTFDLALKWSMSEVCWTDLQKSKRPGADTRGSAMSPKRRKSESVAYLPPELMSMVISQFLTAEPRCALSLVVPDWRICRGEAPKLDKPQGATRILTYTRSMNFFEVGSLSCSFGHGDRDHIFTPMAYFEPNAIALDEAFTLEYIRTLCHNHTHMFTLGINNIPDEAVDELLQRDRRSLQPLRSQRLRAILPFDDEPTDTAKMRAYQASVPIYQHLRHVAVHSPLELLQESVHTFGMVGNMDNRRNMEAFENALDLDRSAHLWLSWSQMPNLESVFLDLRIYSHTLNTERRCLSKFDIIERAQEMGCKLQLNTLVLAGLQSYSFYAVYNNETAEDIERLDTLDGEPNWIKIFRPAIREGGRIVLVDRLTDELFDEAP